MSRWSNRHGFHLATQPRDGYSADRVSLYLDEPPGTRRVIRVRLRRRSFRLRCRHEYFSRAMSRRLTGMRDRYMIFDGEETAGILLLPMHSVSPYVSRRCCASVVFLSYAYVPAMLITASVEYAEGRYNLRRWFMLAFMRRTFPPAR